MTAAVVCAGVIVFAGLLRVQAAPGDPVSLWSNQVTPAVINMGDPQSLELGLKFRTTTTGDVTGVKFYKSSGNLGEHIGNLWDTNGNNLATVTFTDESASGWQTATFEYPVRIAADTTYVVSYFAPQGNFSMDSGYFATSSHTNGPLTALQDGIDGANGVYAYNGSSTYPANPSSSDNYWVDVVFVPQHVKAPVNLKAEQSEQSIHLNWSADLSSVTASKYVVLRDDVEIGEVEGTVFEYLDATSLQPGVTYTYAVKAVDADDVATGPSNSITMTYIAANPSVKVIDSANVITDPEWFRQVYDDGVRLYVMHSTAWGTCTPWYNTQNQLGMALDAGLKIAVYTRDPNCWENGILAAGPYKDKLQFFALDAETDPGVPITRQMVDGVKSLNVRPVIYSGSGMWGGIQGATANDFADVPLWDTDTSYADYEYWQPNYLSPNPVRYGGWNTPNTMRIGVQQEFEYELRGVYVDLNSFDASFLTVGETPVEPPQDPETPVTPTVPVAPIVAGGSSSGSMSSTSSQTKSSIDRSAQLGGSVAQGATNEVTSDPAVQSTQNVIDSEQANATKDTAKIDEQPTEENDLKFSSFVIAGAGVVAVIVIVAVLVFRRI